MLLKTTRFGDIEVDPKDFFSFPDGILGFPQEKQYVVLDGPEECPFKWLQAISTPELAFIITDPLMFKPDYNVPITKADLEKIELKKLDDGIVTVILSVPEDPKEMTANLLGPLVFNSENKRAIQLVLSGTDYSTKFKVFSE